MFLNIRRKKQTEGKKPNRRTNKHTQRLEKTKMFLNISRKKKTEEEKSNRR
jgi:hypothetical protein